MKKFITIFIILVLILAGGYIGLNYFSSNGGKVGNIFKLSQEREGKAIKPGDYVPSKMKEVMTDKRDIAVVVENSPDARPQSGLSSAYVVSEFVVESGITRYLAIFNESTAKKIGPTRSARHHFLDYVFEHDAVFVHFGGSRQGYADLKSLGVENMDGMALDGIRFFRDKTRYAPHNAYTSMEHILEYTSKYDTKSTKENKFKYSSNEVVLNNSQDATIVEVEYPNEDVKYEYDIENKVYKRFIRNKEDKDRETNKQITAKNIIVQQVDYWRLTGMYAEKGVQDMKAIGNGKGYYITEGKMIPITWSKVGISSRTIFKDSEGKEIILNDGNTYVQMQPSNLDVNNLTPKKEAVDEEK